MAGSATFVYKDSICFSIFLYFILIWSSVFPVGRKISSP